MKNKWLTPAETEIIVYELEWLLYKIWKILQKLPDQYHSVKDYNYLIKKNYDLQQKEIWE